MCTVPFFLCPGLKGLLQLLKEDRKKWERAVHSQKGTTFQLLHLAFSGKLSDLILLQCLYGYSPFTGLGVISLSRHPEKISAPVLRAVLQSKTLPSASEILLSQS